MTISLRESPLALSDFAGRWVFRREVGDGGGEITAEVDGEMRFEARERGLVCTEAGVMRLADGAALKAERRTLWREEGRRIAVDFADGKPFHSFDPALRRPEAWHDCAPDAYHVVYDFSDFPAWMSVWRVSGPRKAYEMTTRLWRA